VYSVESEQLAGEQVAALPAEALPFYAELMALLETAPWSGVSPTTGSGRMRICGRMPSVNTTRAWPSISSLKTRSSQVQDLGR
jgi:hypothetical protein